jgi:uncharacterized protein YaaR (DUF327 family)
MPDSIDNIRKSRKNVGSVRDAGQTKKASTPSEPVPVSGEAFFDVLRGMSGDNSAKKLESILSEIKDLAGLLGRRRLLEDLESYRRKVGEFLKLYLSEVLDVKEAAGRRGSLRRKQMLVVKRVDIELEELSKMVMGGAPDFKIMKELGTIEGLLMDLYR